MDQPAPECTPDSLLDAPFAPAPKATSSSQRFTVASDTAVHATVLVAEPDADARRQVMRALKEGKIRALELPSLERIRLFLRSGGGQIRVVVLGVDNVDPDDPALKEILSFCDNSSLAILAYASETGTKTAIRCLDLGAVDFVRKTPDAAGLLAAVRQAQKRQAEGIDPAARNTRGINADQPMDGWVELTATSSLEFLRRMQRFTDLVLAARLPPDVCDDIRTIMEEAGRNAIEWGNCFNTEKTFRISYCLFGDRIILKFEDEGEGFDPYSNTDPLTDPDHLAKRAAAGKRPGGYGIHLLHELMDEVVYSEKGNVVVMTKYLPPAERA